MSSISVSRRRLLHGAGCAGIAAAAATLGSCGNKKEEAEVTANEDLMREHGIIRRALLVYGAAAWRARQQPADVPLTPLLDTARLFRSFAEDYHERALEEAHIFPVVRKLQGPVARLPDVLLAQHQRGREITDYVTRVASGGSLAPAEAPRFAATLEACVAMYEPHAAREDTVLFPAWKSALGEEAYEATGDQFEDIEKRTFGHDGFDDALERIARIETAFGLADLAALTAPAPPAG